MSEVHLHVSNRVDRLALALAQVTARPLASPFTPELVVVQSAAARRWLRWRIAELHQVCANYEFPFLGTVVARLITAAHGGAERPERPTAELLTWRIESALRRCTAELEFAAVARYLAAGDALKRFTLAGRIAGLFDQYRVYRPDLLARWSAEQTSALRGDEAWQAKLWLEVDGASVFDRELTRLRETGFSHADRAKLPARLSIFAPTALAPVYLDLLLQLARVSEVHLFVLRASPEYHGDDLTLKNRARLSVRQESADATGHPLLASWGRADAELTDLLLDAEERLGVAVSAGGDDFCAITPEHLLSTLQQSIFLGAQAESAREGARYPVDPRDRSLVLNSCHSPMREVEVLYDQLLDCFANDSTLRPRDILVMTPEIEKYAPLIRAVFEYPEKEAWRIPYTIADRHPRSESVTIDLFLTLLGLADTRYTAPDIFLLLSSAPLRRRFRLSEDDLSLIRHWIDATAIRWGIDAPHRTTQGVPALDANTWRHGLDRLLLGFACEGHDRELFAGILPQDDVEGDGAGTLGRFISAAEALFGLATTFLAPRPLAAWVDPLLRLATDFFAAPESKAVDDVRYLRSIIARLGTLAAESLPVGELIEFKVVRQFLEDQVGAMEQRGSFLSGGVTFCALKPVRSLPAKVICVLGLNDQVFPRRVHPAQFDLMATRRRGDPSAPADDRFAFLETVLAAGQKLSLSYVGRSVQDNKQVPPSVVVSELIDYLDQAFLFPAGQTAAQFLLVEHPLHAFSPAYFTVPGSDQRLFSYSQANAEASHGIHSGAAPALRPFIDRPLPETSATRQEIELPALIRFWGNPCAYFIRYRLGFKLGQDEEGLPADEPFSLSAWDQYPLKQELLTGKLGLASAASPEAFAARGTLPPGAIGELQLRSLDAEVERFARVVRSHLAAPGKKPPCDIKLILGDTILGGRLNSLHGPGTLHFRCAQLKPKDHLRAWIEHLALCASDQTQTRVTILIGTDALITFRHVADAAAQLSTLCRGFQAGASRPLPFFPASALAYAAALAAGIDDPLKPARQKWHGKWRQPGEKMDPYIVRCFDAGATLSAEFAALTREVCLPLAAHATTQMLAERAV